MTGVELRQLVYFVAVAEHLHFGKAAEALSIGQPAVSQQVARLERTLGTALLDRTPRNVKLTDPGNRFLPRARAVLAAVDQATQSVLDTPGGATSRPLRIGTCSGLGVRLDDFLSAYGRLRPDVPVELTSVPTRARLERVAAGQLDVAFVRGEVAAEGVELVEVWRDRLMAVVPSGHPLARRVSAPIAELAELPLRIVTQRANPALVDLVLGACAAAGKTPRCLEHDDAPVDTLLASIAAGAPSWTVLYESHARILSNPRVTFVPTDPPMHVPTSLAVSSAASSRAVAAIYEACRSAAARASRMQYRTGRI
jgi:DNA-binding transcriptional LysR family regulator